MSTGEQYMVCVWRVYPEAIEFFENGVVWWGGNLHDWRQVDLRESQVFKDRFVVVLRWADELAAGDTRMVWLAGGGRQQVLAAREKYLQAEVR